MKKADHMPRYKQIARQLKIAIERGELKPGARLPSSRTWSQELGISRSTVENAYMELVAQGWLERRGQAGTFVSAQLQPEQAPSEPVVFAGESSDGASRAGSLSARRLGAGDGATIAHTDAF